VNGLRRGLWLAGSAAVLQGCEEKLEGRDAPLVQILQPEEGATVAPENVQVRISSTGLYLASAAPGDARTWSWSVVPEARASEPVVGVVHHGFLDNLGGPFRPRPEQGL
jgi:hypothetical protein